MSAVAIIPARGGSRRLPGKNKKLFHGRPIICYSIDAALESALFDRIIVSTDDDGIRNLAEDMGVFAHERQPRDAVDEVGTNEVVKTVLLSIRAIGLDMVTCVYPCAPLILPWMLQAAHAMLMATAADFVVPMGEWCVDPGMFYAGTYSAFFNSRSLVGPRTRLMQIPAMRAIDINTEEDFSEAERRYAELNK